MIGASKILTVSYGTFSCTLEGFDDPFNTMKAIAEYFRDLAAEDRYFGAEPPTPDAAMLHKIAEREIQRRVEAKINEHGVILRAGDAAAPEGPREIAAPQAAPAVAAPVAEPTVAEAEAEPRPALSDSVAAKLMRIRSAVAQSQAPAAMAAAGVADAEYAEDTAEPGRAEADFDLADVELPNADVAFGGAELDDTGLDTLAVDDLLLAEAPAAEVYDDEAGADHVPFASKAPAADTAITAEAAAFEAVEPFAPEDATFAAPEADMSFAEPEAVATADDPVAEPEAEPVALADDTLAEAEAEPVATADDTLAEPEAEPVALAGAPAFDDAPETADDATTDAFDVEADVAAFLADLTETEAATDPAEAGAATPGTAEDNIFAAAPAEGDEPPAAQDDALIASLLSAADPLPEDSDDALADDDFAALAPAGQVSTTGWVDTAETAETADAPEAAEADMIEDDSFDEDLLAALDAPLTETDAPAETASVGHAALPTDDAAATDSEARADAAPPAADPAMSAAILTAMAADAPAEKTALSEKAQRARARVIKIRRSEPAAAPAPQSEAAADAPLSPEAEADLMRELSEVERELAPAPATITPPRADHEPRKQLPAGTGDDAVNRLIEQTNSEMHEPANRRRLSALAHLKAAVAATVADRRAGAAPVPSDADRSDPYRNDLARVVRPLRAGEPADPDRPAPLVLVSEQRIDRPKPTIVAPAAPPAAAAQSAVQPAAPAAAPAYVRPRRVTSAQLAAEPTVLEDEEEEEAAADAGENLFTETRGFADFAERLGAHALPDLLEAAAAYTACVEGRPHFSRPQLIRHVNAVAPENAQNREAGLRSFGALLRNGKIAKVKRGQFALTESSHFLTEARKIAR